MIRKILFSLLMMSSLPTWAEQVSPQLLRDLPGLQSTSPWPEKKYQYIVLDFWASWCAPCKESAPFLEKQKKIWGENRILWVAINEDSDLSQALAFFREHPTTFLHLQDPNRKLAESLGIDTLPRLLVLDHKFKVLWHLRGFSEDKKKVIEDQFRKLFGKP